MSFSSRLLRRASLVMAIGLFGTHSVLPRACHNIALAAPPAALSPKLSDYVVPKLDDFDTTMKAVFHDDNAARKISRDIGSLYQLKGDVHIRYKEDNKFRADGQLGASKASIVIYDSKQTVKLSSIFKKTDNLGSAPGKRKSLLDMGLISEYYLTYAQGEFLGERSFEGVPCAVFKITYKDRALDSSHRIVWIDPKSKITLRREEYAQDTSGGKLRSVWLYRGAKGSPAAFAQVAPGIYFPSSIELFNNENQKAGETAYTNTRVNVGLSDDVFKL